MSTGSLLEYINNAKSAGLSDNQIQENLKKAGWADGDINNALGGAFNPNVVPIPVPQPSASRIEISSVWDTFEHILLFISLYVLYTSLALTLHFFIDKYIISANANMYGYAAQSSYGLVLLRGYLAALIVSCPLFSFFFLKVTKRTILHPEIRNLGARKSLIYLTLIITFLVLLINIISIIFNFLNGNVSLNFVTHFITTITLSSFIFVYYLKEVKEDRKAYA